eukprot:COSAG02_NODE_2436_length_8868_cov_6.380203_3_plen_658_part_00
MLREASKSGLADTNWEDWEKWLDQNKQETIKAGVAFDLWSFGTLLYRLCVADGVPLFLSTQSDNIADDEDLLQLAFHWDSIKLDKLSKVVWLDAYDLILWCLEGNAERRPNSFGDVLKHPFFSTDVESQPHYWAELKHNDTSWALVTMRDAHRAEESSVAHMRDLLHRENARQKRDAFVQQQSKALAESITSRNADEVERLFREGGVNLKMLDSSIHGSTVTPIMRGAFCGDSTIMEVLLGEIESSWPDEVRKEYLDQRTSHDFTAYMIACARGHKEIVELLRKKGCDVSLVNNSGENGAALLQASRSLGEDSTIADPESYLALLDQKIVVMSCPETGTLKPDGSGPFDQKVMEKVSELVKRGVVKLGFDRAGTSTAVQTEEEKRKWSMAEGTLAVTQVGGAMRSLGLDSTEIELQDMIRKLQINTNGFTVISDSRDETTILAGTIDFIDFVKIVRKMNEMLGKDNWFSDDEIKAQFWKHARATPGDVKKEIFKLTEWWNGYQSSVKAIVKIESQGFDGTLNVTCIEGGPITQLEAAEMPRIMKEAKGDCSLSGITVRYQIAKMQYCDFLAKYEHEPGDSQQAREVANYEAGEVGDNARPDLHAQLAKARARLAAMNEELASVVAAKDELASAVAAKDEESKQMRAQLERLEALPPQ